MYKSIFILPLPIEIQYVIFKHEHIFKFKSVLNDLKSVCYVCKCKYSIEKNLRVPCFQIFIGNILFLTYYNHWKHKDLEKLKYDENIIKKVCNEHNLLYHQVKIRYMQTNKFKVDSIFNN